MGRVIPDEMFLRRKVSEPFEENIRKTLCCMKAFISHNIQCVFNFADFLFFSLSKNLPVNLCDKKQIDKR